MDIKARILEVLEKGYLISLATHDDGGLWVADVVYTFDDDLNIYWMSYPTVRHSKAIEDNNQAAGGFEEKIDSTRVINVGREGKIIEI